MKKFLLAITLTAFCMPTLRSEAFDLSILTSLFNTASNTNTTTVQNTTQSDVLATLTNIQKQTQEVDTSVQDNFLSIVTMLSAKKETNSIKSQLSSILSNKNTTESEKNELVNQILSAYATNLTNNSTSTTSTLKKLSTAQKLELIQNIASLEQAGQKYASLAKQAITTSATNVLKSTSSSNNTTTADDIASIISQTNQTASLIKTKATNTINLANQFKTIATLAGLSK